MLEKSNKRIAKNTLALYCRMILIMVVSLYTSRVVLNALGVEDFGIYNVVGGAVAMLGFFSSSIVTSTQRFLNVGMSNNSETPIKEIFSTAVNVHVLIGLAAVVILETAGLWFVTHKLTIPASQMDSALWVYQCSVLLFFVTVVSAPYNAALIAYEKMTAFAVISAIEVLLKLGVALAIVFYGGNKLKLYAVLLLLTGVVIRIVYSAYCSKKLPDIRYKPIVNKRLTKEMFSFSGWMIFGCLTDLLGTQGVNMLINIFFGPVFNAGRAIAVQVQTAVGQFSSNFMVSVNPQIVRSFTERDWGYTYRLVFTSTKLSFFLMMILVVPIMVRAQELLTLWLKIVPPQTAIFVNLILLEYLVRSLFAPIAQINQASGKVKAYQLSIAIIFLINFIGSYILYKTGFPVYSAFVLSAAMAIVGLFVRLFILHRQVNFPVISFTKDVITRVSVIFVASIAINAIISGCLSANFGGLCLTVLISFVINIALILLLGFNREEAQFIKSKSGKILAKLGFAR